MSLFEFLLININLALFYAIYAIFLQPSNQFVFNRLYLILMPFLAILIPLFPIGETSAADVVWVQVLQEVQVFGTQVNLNAGSETLFTNWIYMGIAFVALVLLSVRLLRLKRLMKGKVMEQFRGTDVYLLQSQAASSFSFFSKIFLSKEDVSAKEPILLHEYAHVKQRHSVDVLLMKFYTAILWFNPVIYLWEKLMKENHEFLADKFVVDQNYPVKEYSLSIVSASFNVPVPVLSNGFNTKSTVRKRIERLQQRKPKNQYNMKYLLVVPVLAGTVWMASCSKADLTESTANVVGDESKAKCCSMSDKVCSEVDQAAEFEGGMDGLMAFMIEEMKYPKDLESEGLEGKVMVEFKVDANGNVEDVVILETGGHEAFDAEALRVIKQMPAWTAAGKDGKAVSSKMVLPISFKLQ